MEINIIFIASLFACVPAHGWLGNYYAFFLAGFKNTFSYGYVQKNHCSNVLGEIARTSKKATEYQKSQQQKCSGVLKEFAATAKANLDACKKQVIQESKSTLVEQLRAPDISPDYFHKSTPTTTRTSVFNNYGAAFLLQQLDDKKKEQEAAQKDEEDCENTGRSEKPRRITDTRELKELGQIKGTKIDKYYINFSANLTQDGKRALRISLIQRKPGFKQMQDPKTLQITDVPCTKKLPDATVIGVENSDNEFEWQKVTNRFDTVDPEQGILNEKSPTRQVCTDEKGKQPVRSIQIDENKNEVFKYKGSDFRAPKKR